MKARTFLSYCIILICLFSCKQDKCKTNIYTYTNAKQDFRYAIFKDHSIINIDTTYFYISKNNELVRIYKGQYDVNNNIINSGTIYYFDETTHFLDSISYYRNNSLDSVISYYDNGVTKEIKSYKVNKECMQKSFDRNGFSISKVGK